jgi:uracil-DNA glycosylase
MTGPPVTCGAGLSKILLVGQAPGDKEPKFGRPFAWTAGKTLFKWFAGIGLDEAEFRAQVYMAAVCRCFPGKNPKGGDRVPSQDEIARCSTWLQQEVHYLQPELLLPVGKLAIAQFMPVNRLTDVIGQVHTICYAGQKMQAIPLPHPSGLSTWYRTEPGKTLLQQALTLIQQHFAWQRVLQIQQ